MISGIVMNGCITFKGMKVYVNCQKTEPEHIFYNFYNLTKYSKFNIKPLIHYTYIFYKYIHIFVF